ncbi:MAG: allantoicase [Myxococcota bacterium]|nr:allantoicase [Myxococcota bacterium]
MAAHQNEGTTFSGLIDLAAQRHGGRTLLASDDFFAPKENLLKPGRGVFLPEKYTDRGKWMDGWEPRRRRAPGHDWCLVKLGIPGTIRAVTVDTDHFLGNHPPFASLDACHAPSASAEQLRDAVEWTTVVSELALAPGAENLAAVADDTVWTHVRLRIYPAGGVARLRIWGEAAPPATTGDVDLAALAQGGLALCCSDMFFSSMNNLLQPQPAEHMGQGWETRRSRPPGEDWVIIKLGQAGRLKRALVDTAFFKGNYPDHCVLQGIYWPDAPAHTLIQHPDWQDITRPTPLGPDQVHEIPVNETGPWTHVRLKIIPDGGISRLRIFGTPSDDFPGENDALVQHLNTLSPGAAEAALGRCCGAKRWIRSMLEARPFRSRTQLFGEAERLWWSLGDGDWLEAFGHHPKIGADPEKLRKQFQNTSDWSEREQSAVQQASDELLERLTQANMDYEAKFGFIFIVCATGKSADEMLEMLQERMSNELPYELRVAAGEQAQITSLRLAKLIEQ